jgi:hypothetical protein
VNTGGAGSPPHPRTAAIPSDSPCDRAGVPKVLLTSPTATYPAGTESPLLLPSALSSVGLPLGTPDEAAHVAPGSAASPPLALWSVPPSLPFVSTAPGKAALGDWSILQKPCRSPATGSDAGPRPPSAVHTSAAASHAAD